MEPPPRPSLDGFPRELLAAIASLVPLHPRLAVLGTLSRRWRSIVFDTLPAFPPHGNMMSFRYERIAHLAPPGLRTFHHPLVGRGDPPCVPSHTHLTALTSLTLQYAVPKCALELLALNATRLTSLDAQVCHPQIDDLLALRFPRLTSLALYVLDEWTLPFFRAHATQLTSLQLRYCRAYDLSLLGPLPALRHLSVGELPPYSLPVLANAAPALASLALDRLHPSHYDDRPPRITSALTALHSVHNPTGDCLLALLALSRLRTLGITLSVYDLGNQNLPLITSRCTSLVLRMDGRTHLLSATFASRASAFIHSHLTRLTLPTYGTLQSVTRDTSFPLLECLQLSKAAPLAYIVKNFPLAQLPRLRTLAFKATHTRRVRRLYMAFLRDLERRGVEEVDMGCQPRRNRRMDGRGMQWLHVTVSEHFLRATEEPTGE